MIIDPFLQVFDLPRGFNLYHDRKKRPNTTTAIKKAVARNEGISHENYTKNWTHTRDPVVCSLRHGTHGCCSRTRPGSQQDTNQGNSPDGQGGFSQGPAQGGSMNQGQGGNQGGMMMPDNGQNTNTGSDQNPGNMTAPNGPPDRNFGNMTAAMTGPGDGIRLHTRT